jgi:hypothetical protein
MSLAARTTVDRPFVKRAAPRLHPSADGVRERAAHVHASAVHERAWVSRAECDPPRAVRPPAAPIHDPAAHLPAGQVHDRLQRALADLKEAEKNAVLWFAQIHSRELFLELGYSSIHQYAQEALGFSRGRTFQFLRLAERLQELPELRRSVEEGTVSWTKARVVAAVATPATEARWIEEAKTKGRREIERQAEAARARGRVARRRPVGQGSLLDGLVGGSVTPGEAAGNEPGASRVEALTSDASTLDVPVEVVLRLRPEQYARMEALLVAAREHGETGDRVEILLAGLEALVSGAPEGISPRTLGSDAQHIVSSEDTRGAFSPRTPEACQSDRIEPLDVSSADRPGTPEVPQANRAPVRSPYRIHVILCPQCGKGEAPTSRGPLPLSLVELTTLACDADVESGGKNRAVIPPRLRRLVLARDRYRCRAAGCGRTRFLHVHHVVPREEGGTNDLANLLTACSACHRVIHELRERRIAAGL